MMTCNVLCGPITDKKEKKVLFLSLYKKAFDVMVTGEKSDEFRTPSKWIKSRLLNKDGSVRKYDLVKFINGFGDHRPFFVVEYEELCTLAENITLKYSNGLSIDLQEGDYVIRLGDVIEKGNLNK